MQRILAAYLEIRKQIEKWRYKKANTEKEIQIAYKYIVSACVPSCFIYVQLFATLWTVACQALLSMGFSMQEH